MSRFPILSWGLDSFINLILLKYSSTVALGGIIRYNCTLLGISGFSNWRIYSDFSLFLCTPWSPTSTKGIPFGIVWFTPSADVYIPDDDMYISDTDLVFSRTKLFNDIQRPEYTYPAFL